MNWDFNGSNVLKHCGLLWRFFRIKQVKQKIARIIIDAIQWMIANVRIWTPPHLQAICIWQAWHDCIRIFGLISWHSYVDAGP